MIDGRRRRVVNGLRLGGLGEVMADLRPGGESNCGTSFICFGWATRPFHSHARQDQQTLCCATALGCSATR